MKTASIQWKNGRLIPVMDTDLTDFPGEQWKPIPDFDDYLVSDYGRIKSRAASTTPGANSYGSMIPYRMQREP